MVPRSTGAPMLDVECKKAFSQQRCHPGVWTVIEVPINFSL